MNEEDYEWAAERVRELVGGVWESVGKPVAIVNVSRSLQKTLQSRKISVGEIVREMHVRSQIRCIYLSTGKRHLFLPEAWESLGTQGQQEATRMLENDALRINKVGRRYSGPFVKAAIDYMQTPRFSDPLPEDPMIKRRRELQAIEAASKNGENIETPDTLSE